MNTENDNPNPTPGHFDEHAVEALLVEFFQAEMPEEFRETAADVPATDVRRTAGAPRRRESRHTERAPARGGAVGLLVASVCLFAVVIAVNGPAGPSPRTTAPGPSVADRNTPTEPPLPAEDDPGPAFHLTTDDLFVESVDGRVESLDSERFDTERGPVEMRAVRETTNVLVVDPGTGIGVDLETEVLDIEVVPIELDMFDPPAVDDDHPDDLPMPRDDRPRLPEEG